MIPRIYVRSNEKWTDQGAIAEWRVWTEDPTLKFSEAERGSANGNARVVDDWLDAIAHDREPICSGEAATKALEMAMAVFEAGLSRNRALLPLKNRKHPLAP
jgi:predicted dehydrogenase